MNFIILLITWLTFTDNTLIVKSPSFKNGDPIPEKYTCMGNNVNPELNFSNVPQGTKTLALIMDDPDAPKGTFVHWVMWNIPAWANVAEDSAPGPQGLNGKNENKYAGPCPPSGTHHYHFKVYALDANLELPSATDKAGLLKAMEGHRLATGELVGTYQK